MEIGMLNFWLGLLVTELTKETYFRRNLEQIVINCTNLLPLCFVTLSIFNLIALPMLDLCNCAKKRSKKEEADQILAIFFLSNIFLTNWTLMINGDWPKDSKCNFTGKPVQLTHLSRTRSHKDPWFNFCTDNSSIKIYNFRVATFPIFQN